MRGLFFLFLASLALAGPARAGDVAQLEILGFSRDGKVFAFEEYGVEDGSGFPYANRYYVDTATDSFVQGSPVRVRLDDESAGLDAARRQAREKGEAIVGHRDYNETSCPGDVLYSRLPALRRAVADRLEGSAAAAPKPKSKPKSKPKVKPKVKPKSKPKPPPKPNGGDDYGPGNPSQYYHDDDDWPGLLNLNW